MFSRRFRYSPSQWNTGEVLDETSKCLGQLLGSLIRLEEVDSSCDWLSRGPRLEFLFNTSFPFQALGIPFLLARILVLDPVLNVNRFDSHLSITPRMRPSHSMCKTKNSDKIAKYGMYVDQKNSSVN